MALHGTSTRENLSLRHRTSHHLLSDISESKHRLIAMRTSLSAFLVAACAISPAAFAFAPPHSAARGVKSTLSLFPEHFDALSTAVDSWQASSHLLADASEAVVEESVKAGGWWGAYLSIFENTIRFVHSTITPPLNQMGITQTWGISIAIFTAGKCKCIYIYDVYYAFPVK